MSRLKLKGLTRKYGAFTAVDDIDLEVGDGEFVTLLGPSGCGKTTTLRMVAGFIAPDGGEIWFDDRRMTDVPPHKRHTRSEERRVGQEGRWRWSPQQGARERRGAEQARVSG